MTVIFGSTYGELPEPTREGYEFDGWYTEKDGGELVEAGTEVSDKGAHTLYAHWTLVKVFSVTVPAGLPLAVTEDGVVTSSTDAAIANNSTCEVKVTGISLRTENGWTLVPFEYNMAASKVDSKLIGFAIGGAQSVNGGESRSAYPNRRLEHRRGRRSPAGLRRHRLRHLRRHRRAGAHGGVRRGGSLMEVLLVEPGKEARIAEIGDGLKSLQAAVGGWIEAIQPFDDPVALVCNDEGKIMQMPLNRALRGEDGKIYDAIAGPFFICGLGEDNFCSLPKELQAKYMEKFRWPEKFLVVGGNLVATQDKPREAARKPPSQER